MASFMQCAHPLESGVTPHRGKWDFLSEFIVQKVAGFFFHKSNETLWPITVKAVTKSTFITLKNRLMQITCLIKSHFFCFAPNVLWWFCTFAFKQSGSCFGVIGCSVKSEPFGCDKWICWQRCKRFQNNSCGCVPKLVGNPFLLMRVNFWTFWMEEMTLKAVSPPHDLPVVNPVDLEVLRFDTQPYCWADEIIPFSWET